jgi:hypothetical protein
MPVFNATHSNVVGAADALSMLSTIHSTYNNTTTVAAVSNTLGHNSLAKQHIGY